MDSAIYCGPSRLVAGMPRQYLLSMIEENGSSVCGGKEERVLASKIHVQGRPYWILQVGMNSLIRYMLMTSLSYCDDTSNMQVTR